MAQFGGFKSPGLDLLGLRHAADESRPGLEAAVHAAPAAANGGESSGASSAFAGSSGSIEDLLNLLPRHLLISPTLGADERNNDARRDAPAHCADDRLAAGLPAVSSGAALHAGAGPPHASAFAAFGKPAPPDSVPGVALSGAEVGGSSSAAGEPAMSIETQRTVAYLSARGRMALAAAAAAASSGQPLGCPAVPPRSPPAAAMPSSKPMGSRPGGFPEADQLHIGATPLGSWPPAPPPGAAGFLRNQQPLRGLPSPLPPPAGPFGHPSNPAAAMAMAAWGWAAAAGVDLPPLPIGFLGSNGGRGPFPAMPRGEAHEGPCGLPSLFPAAGGTAGGAEPALGGVGGRAAALAATIPGPPPPAPPPLISRNLWLGNVMIPNAEVLTSVFHPFGPIESVRVFTGRTYAFVNFMHEAHAAAAKASLEMQVIPELTSAAPLLIRFQQPPEGYRAR